VTRPPLGFRREKKGRNIQGRRANREPDRSPSAVQKPNKRFLDSEKKRGRPSKGCVKVGHSQPSTSELVFGKEAQTLGREGEG